ncbi:hypothetical protein LEP1GSC195_0323 [Leptospira wolbachii serovar Codice str. CDC]|uniref:Uncharacterized protein n=1 Tax=Leptospira wolbachii serovar Codice str. CDC TaxID=1218599 RepID=R8ZXQ6_9LEPT|nr:hypothetical protein LEP1GSC195_0323 [Leptospira wolbachii serovar Codice str. CDC]
MDVIPIRGVTCTTGVNSFFGLKSKPDSTVGTTGFKNRFLPSNPVCSRSPFFFNCETKRDTVSRFNRNTAPKYSFEAKHPPLACKETISAYNLVWFGVRPKSSIHWATQTPVLFDSFITTPYAQHKPSASKKSFLFLDSQQQEDKPSVLLLKTGKFLRTSYLEFIGIPGDVYKRNKLWKTAFGYGDTSPIQSLLALDSIFCQV